jgi:hypothetical protein
MTTAQSETDIKIGIFILKDQNREFFILRVIFTAQLLFLIILLFSFKYRNIQKSEGIIVN